ncbi:MAG: hypothetical protein ACFFDH_05710 [Promethearchaeota archaeon]
MMQTYKLIPQLRENCIIEGKKELLSEYNKGDTIFLIANTPIKKFSIISKIEDIKYSENPCVYIDKRIMENFGENDKVTVLKYNPAEALEVQLNISNEYGIITKGDWTSNIKPSLINKIIDLGQEIPFLIQWEGGAPIVGTGFVNFTLPHPPVYIGERTKILLDKVSNEQLTSNKIANMTIKKERVDILEKQIKEKTIQKIREIKSQNYPNKGIKYKFKATDPRQLFYSISNIFKELDAIEDPTEKIYGDNQESYFASAVFLTHDDTNSFQLIDIQVVATNSSGFLMIWVTAKNEAIITKTLDSYNFRISQLKKGLEQEPLVLSVQCPECGAQLPIKDIDVNGIAECNFCGTISKIPKILRY